MILPPYFKDRPAILMATGPSLTSEVIETVRKYKDNFVILGCNDTYSVVDFLDLHYACDYHWWVEHAESYIEKYPNLLPYTQSKEASEKWGFHLVEGRGRKGLSINSNYIHWGNNSGYQLLNLALLAGCSKFILVGYNMQVVDGKRHYFGNHPGKLNTLSPYTKFVRQYNTIQKRLKPYIVNCTPNSALTMFRYNNLEDELCAS